MAEDGPDLAPGKARLAGNQLLAGTGEGWLRLEQVQREGEEEIPGSDFAARHFQGGPVSFSGSPDGGAR